MLQYLEYPLNEDAIGTPVNIVDGLLAGRSGVIDSLPDNPHSLYVMVELDRDGGNVWIEVEHLEETPNTELYAGRPDLLDLLRRQADCVMHRARVDVEHTVGRTKRGPVDVSYSRATRVYELTTRGGRWTARGSAGVIRKELINLFDVREEPEEGEGLKAA